MPPTQRYICINAADTADDIAGSLFDPALDIKNTASTCSLEDICGFGGFSNPKLPDQSFRFLTPLFVHTGLVHCGVDMLALLFLGSRLEGLMNPLRFGGK